MGLNSELRKEILLIKVLAIGTVLSGELKAEVHLEAEYINIGYHAKFLVKMWIRVQILIQL